MNVLKTAIELAVKNGWLVFNRLCVVNGHWWIDEGTLFTAYDDVEGGVGYYGRESYTLEQIIFDISFAKCLFGEEIIKKPVSTYQEGQEVRTVYGNLVSWMYHIRRYSILDNTDRLAYLGEWLKD